MSTDLLVTSGDAYLAARRLVVTVRDSAGAADDLTGVDLTFMVKRRRSDDDSAAVITKVTPTQIALAVDPTTGIAYIALAEADTADLSGRFYWELEADDATGKITLARGVFRVTADLIEGA